jgi:prepilin-type N-terminal cleavage/methylation domain-containing protein
MKSRKGFTLIELMVVVLIVGILAAVAIPLMRGRIDSAKWSEAKSAMGTIATALRAYAAEKGDVTDGDVTSFPQIGIEDTDLDGTYFSHDCYTITSASAVDAVLTAQIDCDATASTKPNPPSAPSTMTLNIVAGEASFTATVE